MKEETQKILRNMRSEIESATEERTGLQGKLQILNKERRVIAREYANEALLPNLNPDTIQRLRKEMPGFPIPTVDGFFDGVKRFFGGNPMGKIDPAVSLELLRIQLGQHLDSADRLPREWTKKISKIDSQIRDLQEHFIPNNEKRLNDLSKQLEALKKLAGVDLEKINPKLRRQLETALESQRAKKGKQRLISQKLNQKSPPSFPKRDQLESESGPGLIETWLWYQLLSPHSDFSQGVSKIEPGEGEFQGAGASGEWSEKEPSSDGRQFSEATSATISAGIVASAVESRLDDIQTHQELGAGSYS